MQHSRMATRILTRILLALVCITFLTMVFIGRCGLNLETNGEGRGIPEDFTRSNRLPGARETQDENPQDARTAAEATREKTIQRKIKRRSNTEEMTEQEAQQLQQQTDHLRHLLAQREEQHRNEISKLRQQIEALRKQVAAAPVRNGGLDNALPMELSPDMNAPLQYDSQVFGLGKDAKRLQKDKQLSSQTGDEDSPSDVPPFHDFVRRSGIEGPPPSQLSVLEEQRVINSKLDLNKFFDQRLEDSEVLHGQSMRTEYEVIPYNRFTLTRLFMVDPGLGRRVVEKPIGLKKKDFLEVIAKGVETLNHRHIGSKDSDDDLDDVDVEHTFVMDDFVEGIYRTEPAVGTHYELYFKVPKHVGAGSKSSLREQLSIQTEDADDKFLSSSTTESTPTTEHKLKKVILFRPFAPLQLVKPKTSPRLSFLQPEGERALINLILPLSGRIDKFRSFMEKFVRICIKGDKRVFLTVVYFGEPGLKEVTNILGGISKLYTYKSLKLITVNDSAFSRGKGLQVGVEAWGSGSSAGHDSDVLMFLCDVDIIFNGEFLERCRANASPGVKVYYPILFSLYNPNIVYSLHDVPIPSEIEQLVISKDTGWWRDFGYGMTCQYRSDFLAIKGFDEEIQGWGGEDVALYRKYVKSSRRVIRAVDPGIFHMWHEKNCDPNLSADQYRNCIRSKALNEASHAQLGLLAFKDEIDIHRSYLKKDEMKNIPQSKINR